MHNSPKQLDIYFHPAMPEIKKKLAYASSLGLIMNEIDCSLIPLTELRLEQLVAAMNLNIIDLVNLNSDAFEDKDTSTNYGHEDWLKILVYSPELMKHPIVVIGEKTILFEEVELFI